MIVVHLKDWPLVVDEIYSGINVSILQKHIYYVENCAGSVGSW